MIDLPSMLEGVRQTRDDQWLAKCPAHEDRRASLSIRRADDRWLIYCFAGCTALEIVQVLGLEFGDLFADGRPKRNEPGRHRHRLTASERLELAEHEITVAAFIVDEVLVNRTITDTQAQRLAQAGARLGKVRHV